MSSRSSDIFQLASAGDSKNLAEHLNVGVSVETQSIKSDGVLGRNYTPLFCAVLGESKDAVELLLMRGAEVGAKNDTGNTSIHIASMSGNIEILQLLLQNKANVNETNDCNTTPLHCAVGFKETQTVKLLLESQADVSIMDYPTPTQNGNTAFGSTALRTATSMSQSDQSFPMEIIELLKEAESKKNFDCKR